MDPVALKGAEVFTPSPTRTPPAVTTSTTFSPRASVRAPRSRPISRGTTASPTRSAFTGRYSVNWNAGTGVNLFGPGRSGDRRRLRPVERTQPHLHAICRGNVTYAQNPTTVWVLELRVSSTPTTSAIRSGFRFEHARPAQVYVGQRDIHDFPMFDGSAMLQVGTQGYCEDGPPGRRAPVLGLDDENQGCPQPQDGRRIPSQLAGLRPARISAGQFTFGPADHQPGSQHQQQPAGQRLRVNAARLGQRLQLPHRSEGLPAGRITGASSSRTTGRSAGN